LANRLCWFFNLTGPSANIDLACSSSMIALDMSCQGLRNKGSNMALVGGPNSLISPGMFMSLTNMNFLSPNSLCYRFDSRAIGCTRGEGYGVLVLKRIEDAIRDGDTIRAVIRYTGA
ncbi:thiolase-like protein, partial [Zopfia rhizophila CBS 207.26]